MPHFIWTFELFMKYKRICCSIHYLLLLSTKEWIAQVIKLTISLQFNVHWSHSLLIMKWHLQKSNRNFIHQFNSVLICWNNELIPMGSLKLCRWHSLKYRSWELDDGTLVRKRVDKQKMVFFINTDLRFGYLPEALGKLIYIGWIRDHGKMSLLIKSHFWGTFLNYSEVEKIAEF